MGEDAGSKTWWEPRDTLTLGRKGYLLSVIQVSPLPPTGKPGSAWLVLHKTERAQNLEQHSPVSPWHQGPAWSEQGMRTLRRGGKDWGVGGGVGRVWPVPPDMHALHCCHCWHSFKTYLWISAMRGTKTTRNQVLPQRRWQSSRGDTMHAGSTWSELGFPKMSLTWWVKSAGLRKKWRKLSGHWHQAGEEGRGVRGCWGGTQGTWMGSGHWEWGKGKQVT